MLLFQVTTFCSLLTFSRTKLTVVLLWMLLVSVYPLCKLQTLPPLTSVTPQDSDLQQAASRLQTPAHLSTCSINVTSPLRAHFTLFSPTALRHYRVTYIVTLPRIKPESSSSSNSSSSLSLVLLTYTFSALLL
jgi:hypothetical protein